MMHRKSFTVLAAVIGAALAMSAGSAAASEPAVHEFSITARPLNEALNAFAQQADLRIVFDTSDAEGITSPALNGKLTAREALDILLRTSKLTYRFMDERTVAVSSPQKISSLQPTGAAASGAGNIRLAEAASTPGSTRVAADAGAGSPSASAANSSDTLFEVVVTAQKRAERLQDVPIPVTAIDTQALLGSNQLRLQDYYSRVPGLNYSPGQWGEPRIAIRGIVTDPYTNPTVGLMVDDIPYGLSTNQNGGGGPDIDPGDLARIEVLRGPQGTLYGASSMGGLLKYVTIDPSTEEVSGRLQLGTTSVSEGDDLGYSVRASVNVPLSDTFAIRASAFTREEPGYIDNVETGESDVNDIEAQGARLAALWQISDDVTLKVSALAQKSETGGSNVVEPDLGGLRHSLLPTAGQYERGSQAFTANLSADLGRVDFVSLTGYNADSFRGGIDLTTIFGALAEALYGEPYGFYKIDQDTRKFTQEFRVSMGLGERVDWRVGAFYTDEDVETPQQIFAADSNAQFVGSFLDTGIARVSFQEYALFSDLMIRLSDRFDIQVGARQSWIEQVNDPQAPTGPLAGPATPELRNEDEATTYLFTPQFKFSPDLMLYARIASGYRPGGINFYNPVLGSLPPYKPDETENYEIGVKGSAWDRLLTFDASAYYIDWTDIQLVVTNVISYYDNAGGARSRGLELSAELRPHGDWTIAAWVTWGEAEITEGFPDDSNIFGAPGDRLPYSPRVSGNLSVDKGFDFIGQSTASAGLAYRYVGDRAGGFRPAADMPQPELPSYSQFDFRFDVTAGAWLVSAFVNNIADERGVTGIAPFENSAFNYIQPRTIGASLTRSF